MRISVFGLGYVGTVSCACLARDGHEVVGVDVNASKVATLRKGRSPIVEPGLEQLLATDRVRALLQATTDSREAVETTDVSLISVGTPSRPDGLPDLSYVERVCQEIARCVVAKAPQPHVVVLRSTVPAGTTERCEIMMSELGADIHMAFNPEFLREGSAVNDYDQPPYTVIGTRSEAAEAALRTIYETIDAPILVVEPAVAELVKYAANAWHATKIVFANEMGRIAKNRGINARQVMEILVQDNKLNISPAYLRPGFAYGGSCLPKDVRALVSQARRDNIDVPLLSSLPVSNSRQIEDAVELVTALSRRRVGVLGLAFKPATDDLRESPSVILVKRLIGEGYEVRIYAPDVNRAFLTGTNLDYIRSNLPHFEALLTDDLPELLDWAQALVVTQARAEFFELLEAAPDGVPVVDLADVLSPSLAAAEGPVIA